MCIDCVKQIEKNTTPLCPACGKISLNSKYCFVCKKQKHFKLNGLIVACNYNIGPTKEIIHHLKYHGFVELADILGELICEKLKSTTLIYRDFIIVPVPLYRKKENIRGFNQAELIARYVGKRLKIHGGNSLIRRRDTKSQTELRKEERRKNVSGAFSCDDPLYVKGKKILLIDDVATTGSTLNECSAVLRDSGAKEVWGVVVAKRK